MAYRPGHCLTFSVCKCVVLITIYIGLKGYLLIQSLEQILFALTEMLKQSLDLLR
jgi:hypothetical protein